MSYGLLATDGYKFSMAEVGWPLRTETFYYTHRRGGVQYLPVDVPSFIKSLLPELAAQRLPTAEDYEFLHANEYEVGAGYRAAMIRTDKLVIRSLPKGTFFYDREPVFSVTGPSALVSWLEPLVLQLHYRIQVATLALRGALDQEVAVVTCPEQVEIIRETLDAVNMKTPPIVANMDGYHDRVFQTVQGLVKIVKDPARIFEVGLRSATCMQQHAIALTACKKAGVTRTSNVYLAKQIGMTPVGTMGHEHVQRYGSDEAAFRAMRDRRPHRSSYLLDTYDTYLSGIPAALKLMEEDPERQDSMRYDSGDKLSQYLFAIGASKARGLEPTHIIEDGLKDDDTIVFENARLQVGWKPEKQVYGYGGYIVAQPGFGRLTRDNVQAVWKLCQTGPYPTMKFGSEIKAGKESIPGRPVIFRRTSANGPVGIIAQEGEECPEGYRLITGPQEDPPSYPTWIQGFVHRSPEYQVVLSEGTNALRHKLMEDLRGMKVGLL